MSEKEFKYPCGKTDMDLSCPDCLDHFKECAKTSVERGREEDNVFAYMTIQYQIKKNESEQRCRALDRAKARNLAKRIMKRRDELLQLQKELSTLYFNDNIFSFSERHNSVKFKMIMKALDVRVH
jgi:hypothetical protein